MTYSPRIYQAEHILRHTFDRYHAGAQILVHGTQLVIPQEQKFHALTELEEYIAACLNDTDVMQFFGKLPPIRVRLRKGVAAAHYEPANNTIAIPLKAGWAGRELVVLHEMAHHIQYQQKKTTPNSPKDHIIHNQNFLEIYLELIGIRLGEQAKFLAWTIFLDAHIWEP